MNSIFADPSQLYSLGIAGLLGAFLGLRREIAASQSSKNRSFMGLRTMTLLSVLGAFSTFFPTLPSLPIVFFGAVLGLVLIAYAHGSFNMNRMGITTELTAIMIYWVGVLVAFDRAGIALVIVVSLAMINAFKQEFHNFAETINLKEWRGILQLLIVSGLILPLLPHEAIDPWGIFNPFETWLIVITISGIGFIGYFLIKYLGDKAGIPLMSLLGGIVSSTAVSTSMAAQSKKVKKVGLLSAGILMALSMMQVKVFVYLVSLGHSFDIPLKLYLLPLMLAGGCLLFAIYFYKTGLKKISIFQGSEEVELDSPFEIVPALKFGVIYVVILAVLYFAQKTIGESGVYVAAFLSGLVDIDSIVLASLRQAGTGQMAPNIAANAIAIGVICNTIVKLLYIKILGAKYLMKEMTLSLTIVTLVASLIYIFV